MFIFAVPPIRRARRSTLISAAVVMILFASSSRCAALLFAFSAAILSFHYFIARRHFDDTPDAAAIHFHDNLFCIICHVPDPSRRYWPDAAAHPPLSSSPACSAMP